MSTKIIDINPADRFKLDDAFVALYASQKPDFGPLGEVTYRRTYSRQKPNGNYEQFFETLQRVVEGVYTYQKWHCKRLGLPWNDAKAQRSAQEMYSLFFKMKCLPPGRGLWMAGSSYVEERGSMPLVNCSFSSTAHIDQDFAEPFCFLADASMLGVGVGVDTRGAGKLTIQNPNQGDDVHVVPDTREGWVDLLRRVLNAYVGKATLPAAIDYSQIRPEGAPIKGFGGVSSGPAPLEKLIDGVQETLNQNIGRPITSTTIVDIANRIGVCVVSGNVRRSAEVLFGDADDAEFMELKDPSKFPEAMNGWRWASNNSVFATVGMDYSKPAALTAKNGEPGYFWLDNARMTRRFADQPDDSDSAAEGSNPCIRKGQRILTDRGWRQIESLVDTDVQLFDGITFVPGKVWKTGTKPIVRLHVNNGRTIDLTADHQVYTTNGWVAAKDTFGASLPVAWPCLPPARGEGYLPVPIVKSNGDRETGSRDCMETLGFFFGDGSLRDKHVTVCYTQEKDGEFFEKTIVPTFSAIAANKGEVDYKPSALTHGVDFCRSRISDWLSALGFTSDRVYDRRLPAFIWALSQGRQCSFLRGLFGANGNVLMDARQAVVLVSTCREMLLEVQLLLQTINVACSVRRHNKESKVKWANGEYTSRESYHLEITQKGDIHRFARLVGFPQGEQQFRCDLISEPAQAPESFVRAENQRNLMQVTRVEDLGIEDEVYDFSVPTTHMGLVNGLLVHNCLEIQLESGELCNLGELFPSRHDSLDEFKRTIKFAYLYCKTITLIPTHNEHTNAVVMRNRRIGLSMSGIQDAIAKLGRREFLRWCDEGYKYLQRLDQIYSDWLCVPRSKRMTSVKPSGSVSLLPGVSPGIHYPHARFYHRTIRIAKTSPLLAPLGRAGYRIEQDVCDASSMVVYFPIKENHFKRAKADVSIWEQVANAAALNRFWADNMVSITVTFKPEEANQIQPVLEAFEDQLKSVSFLPLSDHGYQQAPYQTITEEEYEAAIAKLSPVAFDTVEHEVTERFCDGDKCTI